MRVKQHISSFIEATPEEYEEVNTLVELLALPFVSKWKEVPGFLQFSKSSYRNHWLLMADLDTAWSVVAHLFQVDIKTLQDLPDWKYRKLRHN
jgi:hypothetical protein